MSGQESTTPASDGSPSNSAEGINVFYTGLPPYHPLAIAQGWDPARVDDGVRSETIKMVQAGYNVYVVAAGPEIAREEIAQKLREKGVKWHITGIGMGVRTASDSTVIHYLEDLVQLFRQETPEAYQVFNSGPSSCLESLEYRIPRPAATNQPGRLIGYEELFDGQKGQPLESIPT